MSQRQIAMLGAATIGNHITFFDLLTLVHNRALVNTGALVGTIVFTHPIGMEFAVGIADHNLVACDADGFTIFFTDDNLAGVISRRAFHAGTNDRDIGSE